jgi:hypothetical protein
VEQQWPHPHSDDAVPHEEKGCEEVEEEADEAHAAARTEISLGLDRIVVDGDVLR